MRGIIQQFSKMTGNFIYLIASIALVSISTMMIVYALSQVIQAIITQKLVIDKLLDGISLIVIAIAGFDVSKYLTEEEVLRERELRSPREAWEHMKEGFSDAYGELYDAWKLSTEQFKSGNGE